LSATAISNEVLTNAGERMVEGNMWGYWAHLSIYHFALEYTRGRRVLDAGSGAGYGAAYLSRHGAQVLALDYSPVAVEHSRARYAGDAVTFEAADLGAPLQLGDGVFDVVFSSNVFEHIANVDGLAAECARVVDPAGVVIVAVPPIVSAEAMAADMLNQFHVHHIPPTAWEAKLRRFFDEVKCHRHVGRGVFGTPERERLEMTLPPDQVAIRETDFEFPEASPIELQTKPSYTAVFVCRGRRWPAGPETLAERTPSDWREGAVAARLLAEARQSAEAAGPAALAEAAKRAEAAEQRAEQAEQRAAAMAAARVAAAAEREAAAQALAAAIADRDSAVHTLAAADAAAASAAHALAAAEAERDWLRGRVAALEGSTSWRLTAPVRKLARFAGGRGWPRG
jgi:SAM-dependent methyltransferase